MVQGRLKQSLQPFSQLFSNTGWLFSAEIFAKLSRIITIVVLAASLTPISYGTAMLSLAAHDMLSFLLRAGAGTQIIQCKPHDLINYAKNGATIQWIICLTLATLQFFSADFIAEIYSNPELANLLKVMATIYLFYPWVSIRVFLLHRANCMRWFSLRSGLCTIIENLSIALFALLGADIMAVAYGKVVFSLLWLLLFSFSPIKAYGVGFNLKVFKQLLRTSGQLASSEFLRTLRMNADVFIAGKLMTPEISGFYIFAKNAGIGLSQSIGNVFTSALFPFLCKLQRQGILLQQQRFVYFIAIGVGLLFVGQALLVPLYVPIIFDAKWHFTIPVVTTMCLIALPTVIVNTYCMFERAKGSYINETITRLVCLLITVLMLVILAPKQPMDFAIVLLFSSLLWCVALYFGPSIKSKVYILISLLNWRKSHEY
ncbi:MAG: oligosaccharide flippase family protein [Colwellia sp.]|nr:oligosaccharide flippase family protein [Colwellia sp.]